MGGPAMRLADAIRQGQPVMALLGVDAAPMSAALDDCTALLLDDPVRVIRVHGLPGVPLTLPRMVEVLGAGQGDGQKIDDDELIVRVLARRSDREEHVALIIEQAELLPLPTLAFLQVALTVFGARTPRLQLIFAGHPKFEQLLVRGELAGLRERLETVIHVARLPVDAAPAAPDQAAPLGLAGRQRSASGLGRGAKTLAALAVLIAVIGVTAFAITRRDTAQQADQVKSSAPVKVTQAGPSQAVAPASPPLQPHVPQSPTPPPLLPPLPQPTPPQPTPLEPPRTQAAIPPNVRDAGPAPAVPHVERGAVPSGDQLTRLRGEFDRFLAQTEWGSKRLGEGERARLFNEYLRWNYGAAGANAGPPP